MWWVVAAKYLIKICMECIYCTHVKIALVLSHSKTFITIHTHHFEVWHWCQSLKCVWKLHFQITTKLLSIHWVNKKYLWHSIILQVLGLLYIFHIPAFSSQSTHTPLKSDIASTQRVACYHRLFQHIICTGNAVLWSLVILLMQHASQHNASGGYFLGLLYYGSLSDEEPITPTPFPPQYKLIGKFISL